MRSVVCFGEALIDFLAAPSTGQQAPQQFVRHAGGAPANVAVAVAQLGVPSVFVGMLGRDMFGDFLLERLKFAGVSTYYVARTDVAKTALAFVSLNALGERQFSFYRPPSADLLFRARHFDDACFNDTAIFHACSNSLTEAEIADTTLEGMHRAHATGALVSFDMNLRSSLWRKNLDPHARIWRALREAELVKLSASELAFLAEPLGGETAALSELWRGRTQWLWVTNGGEPLRHFTRSGSGVLPTFQVQTVNTTAAGDAFVGGMLSWLLRENVVQRRLEKFLADEAHMRSALRFAAACGALAVTRHGAFESMPSRAEVEQFLREHT
ncbi:MAG: carbohydrate kinase [Gammaproteobacteria bacterium]